MEMKGSKREEVRRNEERVLREAEERRRKTVPEEVKQEKREERERKTDKMRPHVGKENTFFVAAIIPPEKRPVVSNVIREEIGSIAFEANLDIITKDEASALQSAESKLFGGLNPKDGIAAVALSAANMNEVIDKRELENVQGMFISMEYEAEESREEGKPRLYIKKGRKSEETTAKGKKEQEASKREGESVDDVEKMRSETEGMQIREKQRESRQDARQNVPQTGRSE
ncbi:uncharacterized protein LOC136040183 [Artemia franciscana]|uniref:uncharacterized protein LOC136040183 n=1 Tax=Artemia franciscana TaxID=6661 RepID=UPI0032DA277C